MVYQNIDDLDDAQDVINNQQETIEDLEYRVKKLEDAFDDLGRKGL